MIMFLPIFVFILARIITKSNRISALFSMLVILLFIDSQVAVGVANTIKELFSRGVIALIVLFGFIYYALCWSIQVSGKKEKYYYWIKYNFGETVAYIFLIVFNDVLDIELEDQEYQNSKMIFSSLFFSKYLLFLILSAIIVLGFNIEFGLIIWLNFFAIILITLAALNAKNVKILVPNNMTDEEMKIPWKKAILLGGLFIGFAIFLSFFAAIIVLSVLVIFVSIYQEYKKLNGDREQEMLMYKHFFRYFRDSLRWIGTIIFVFLFYLIMSGVIKSHIVGIEYSEAALYILILIGVFGIGYWTRSYMIAFLLFLPLLSFVLFQNPLEYSVISTFALWLIPLHLSLVAVTYSFNKNKMTFREKRKWVFVGLCSITLFAICAIFQTFILSFIIIAIFIIIQIVRNKLKTRVDVKYS